MKGAFFVAGVLAVVLAAQSASAEQAQGTGTIQLNADVQPFINITVNTPTMTWTSTTPGANHNNTGALGTTPGVHRALFTVASNSHYNLVVESSTGCWTASDSLSAPWSTFPQVRFVSGAGGFIGSNIDLDRNPGSVGVTYEWSNINRSSSPPTFTGNCNLVSGNYPPETHQWALAAQFNSRIFGNASNPNGVPGGLAPPGIYSTTAIITASTTP